MTKEQLLRARSIAIDTAAWIAVIAVLICKLLALTFDFICDRVLPLVSILATHAVLAWQDYTVGRIEYLETVPAPRKPQPKGFRS